MENHGTKQDLENQLTRIRGQVRRLPEGVAKERASLLAAQLENGVPAPYLARQVEIMASALSGGATT